MDEQTTGGKASLFATRQREALFLDMAAAPEGAAVLEVYRRAKELGDIATEEAYYNLARRLVHRGLLVQDDSTRPVRYKRGAPVDEQWLDEEQLAAIVDQDYPLIAVTIWKESRRHLYDIPDSAWVELRERLKGEPARELFRRAILSYCEDLLDQLRWLVELQRLDPDNPELSRERQVAEDRLRQLRMLTKFGLGLSEEAVRSFPTVDQAVDFVRRNPTAILWDDHILQEELASRVADEPFIVDVNVDRSRELLVSAVDGSSRGGLLSFIGEGGDFYVGGTPTISINTAVAEVNRLIRVGQRRYPAFLRLPEKPEDMQQRDNRYTVMAKLFFPDLSEAQYIHSVWNAMDLVEARTTLRVMSRWYTARTAVEVPPADVVLRDGTVTPQDRDFHHYAEQTSYGRIVRDMIEVNWEIAKKCRDDGHTVAGIVKTAELSVFAPVFNWYATQLAAQKSNSQITAWPLLALNNVPDQAILTRLLTAGRKRGDDWTRTCLVLRPFHAATNFSTQYRLADPPWAGILKNHADAKISSGDIEPNRAAFWANFRGENDPYVQMLRFVWYASFFLASVPRLDFEKYLPRTEFQVPHLVSTSGEEIWSVVDAHRDRLLAGLKTVGFEVSAEHSMFEHESKLDVLPALIVKVHDTVKMWATELLSRVQEYIGYHLSRYVQQKSFRGVKVRPFTRAELEFLYQQLRRERDLRAGGQSTPELEPGEGGGEER